MAIESDLFRVKVVLQNYFEDHKSKAYVSVDRQWKNVRQFHRHIREMFDLNHFILQTSDGFYLPNKESIKIIEPGDVIVLLPKTDTHDSAATLKSMLTERNVAEMSRDDVFKTPSASVANTSWKKSSKLSVNDLPESVGDSESFDTLSMTTSEKSAGSKRKRVRRRKKKNVATDENDVNEKAAVGVESVASGGNKKNVVDNKADGVAGNVHKNAFNRHVRFDDDESVSEPDEVYKLPKRARVISANVVGMTKLNGTSGPQINIVDEKTAYQTANETIEMRSEPSAISSNGNAIEPNATAVQPNDSNAEKKESALEHLAKNIETIAKYRELGADAKENDIIAFKVFTPDFQKSDYIIGMIEGISGHDENTPNQMECDFTLLIMAGKEHIRHLSSSDFAEDENIRIQISKWDIFDVKVLEL